MSVSNAVSDSIQRLLAAATNVLPAIATAVVVLGLFWGLATLVRLVARAGASHVSDRNVRALVTQASYYFVWLLGFIVMFDALGLNLQTVVTGLGLGGVAIGFALKDILSNLVSGMLILMTRPFELGDQIVIGDTEGTVEQIELRATQIRTYDGRLVLVPNGEVFTSRITNNTESPLRRASVSVYLDYKEDTGRAMSVILNTVKSVPGVASEPAPSMRLHDLSLDCVQIEARLWADSHRTDLMNTASAARIAIVDALKAAGIRLPDRDLRKVTITESRPSTS